MIRLNPAIEAFYCGNTLAVFAGDRCLTFRGPDNLKFFELVRSCFAIGKSEDEIQSLDPAILSRLDELITLDILIKESPTGVVEFYDDGSIAKAMQTCLRHLDCPLLQTQSLLVCIPDQKGLRMQKEAVTSMTSTQYLLTGVYRGSSIFVLPLLPKCSSAEMVALFCRLLSTEAGIGNAYLINEFINAQDEFHPSDTGTINNVKIANWVAGDLCALISQGALSKEVGRVYRGTLVRREDVAMASFPAPVHQYLTVEEQANALATMFVGLGRPISRFTEYRLTANAEDVPATFAVRAEMARPLRPFQQDKEDLGCWGTGESLASARLAAFMEALERYSISGYCVNDYPLCQRRSISLPVLDRIKVAGYGEGDTCCPDLPDDVARRWHPVESLLTGRQFLVPLELVRYPVIKEEAGYEPPDHVTSSGVAAHFSRQAAIHAACYELIERDAFLIAWLRRARPPIVILDSLPERVQNEIRPLLSAGYHVHILDLTADLAPVACVVLSRSSTFFRYSIGAASREAFEEACSKAIREALINFTCFSAKPRAAATVLTHLTGPMDHLELYAGGENDDLLMKFLGSHDQRTFSHVKSFHGSVVDRIHEAGMEVLVADVVSTWVRQTAPNIHVVRAIIPGLVPIDFGRHWARTGSSRIQSIPERAGWMTEKSVDYERFPHPFS